MLRIAPVGRYRDSIQIPYDDDGRFRGLLPTLSTVLEGRMSASGNQLEIEAGRVTIGGAAPVEIVVHGELLPPLP
jgi:hypothetical protein